MGNHRAPDDDQLAWLWPIHQPNSALTRWCLERTKGATKLQKKKMVVALARKLARGAVAIRRRRRRDRGRRAGNAARAR